MADGSGWCCHFLSAVFRAQARFWASPNDAMRRALLPREIALNIIAPYAMLLDQHHRGGPQADFAVKSAPILPTVIPDSLWRMRRPVGHYG